MDVYTKRPRTPNDQYTVLTDEQVKNIQKTASPHFHISESKERANPSVRANGRAYKDRFVHSVSETHLRGDQLHQPYCWIADGWKQGSDAPYDTCRGRAAARWGVNSIGERTRSHFFGESADRYTNISMYCRPATNYPGPVTMKFGRAAEGYYAQKLPLIFSHYGASMNLNQSTAMPHTRPKTTLEYETEQQNERDFRQQRQGQWPEYTEYTDKYLLHSKTLPYYMEKKLETAAARTATNKVPIEQLA